jgi:protocatechuate 3,4-dioxygenase beta subunit
MSEPFSNQRRRLLGAALALSALATARGAAAEALVPTPPQSRGPFYPLELPLDSDNDLTRVQGSPRVARGEITDLVGRVVDASGRPLAQARVEIWQCDANGRYHHPRDTGGREPDPGFQGYGQFLTGDDGGYRFRTIKPVPYPGRAPHIHFAVSGPGFERLVTQMYVEGAPENAGDFLLGSVRDPAARRALVVPFAPSPTPGEYRWLAHFDLVLVADGRFERG